MRRNTGLFASTLVGVCLALPAFAEQQRTGSHLNSRAARPAVLQVNAPTKIDEIEKLIAAGRNQQAVAAAYAHVEELRTKQNAESPVPETLYYALNALCIALMSDGQTDLALDSCADAIAESPREWSAWNSRGTVYFLTGNFEDALDNFLRASALAPREPEVADTIRSNIRLTQQRIAGN